MNDNYRTLGVDVDGHGVVTVAIDAPMNLVGPELVRDLVALLGELETDPSTRVMVLESADPEYFIPHVDLTQVAQNRCGKVRAARQRVHVRAATSCSAR